MQFRSDGTEPSLIGVISLDEISQIGLLFDKEFHLSAFLLALMSLLIYFIALKCSRRLSPLHKKL